VDHGQAATQAAQSRSHRFAEQKRLTLLSSQVRIDSLKRALMTQQQRLTALQQQVLPRGQAILRDVRRAFEARAVPLTDLNQAQRALDELLLQEAAAFGDLFRLSVDLLQEGASDE
jgi:outer membrane protein TolC